MQLKLRARLTEAYKNAPYERRFVGDPHIQHFIDSLNAWPARYATLADMENDRPVPMFEEVVDVPCAEDGTS